MIRFQILSPWIGSGTENDPYRPGVADTYPMINWVDVTAQPAANIAPTPNLAVFECIATDPRYSAILGDPSLGPASILWEEPI